MPKTPIQDKRNRKVQKSGALTIPADLRRRYGIKEGQPVRVEVNSNGQLTIIPHKPYCAICGKNTADHSVRKVPICEKCATEAKEAYSL